ncbi:MAG: cation:dicarboxylase symporter family transporter [Lachnospiraceae bacterium]|nr:cation:dicarboxylase symporter family transporter [Lachnospiraceae bacterium]
MAQYRFLNSNIDLACEEIDKFLLSADVEQREALRIKFTFEEVLLKYQEKLGEDASFKVRFIKWLSSIKIEIIVEGESYDVFDIEGEEDDVIQGLLAGIGLAPVWNYKKGKNHVVFTPKKKPLSGTIKMIMAIGLAVIAGIVLNLLPDGVREGVNEYLLTPLTNAFMGLLSAVSAPLVFLSVLGSICSMGNMETLGKIGSKTIKTIFLYMTIIGVLMTAIGSQFYQVGLGGSGSSGFSQVLDLIYAIVPSNLFEPFVTGNTLQLIFIAIMTGLAMLVLSSRVNRVFEMVEQLSLVVQTIMTVLSSMLPMLIFILFTGMISNGNLDAILNSWKSVMIILLLMMLYYIINLFRIAITQKVSPILLWKKTMPAFMIAVTTASSAAAFTTNVKDAIQKLGIDKKACGVCHTFRSGVV